MPTPVEGVLWYDDVLAGLGLGSTSARTMCLYLWAKSEGMPASAFNWCAASDKRPGSSDYNSSGVQVYPSYQVGVDVYVAKLGSALYRPILLALHADDPEKIWAAINTSPWCAHCQNGQYPVALFDWLHAGQPATGVVAGGVAPRPPQQTGARPDSWHESVRRTANDVHESGLRLGAAARVVDGLKW